MGVSIKFVAILIVPIIFFFPLGQFIKKILIRTEPWYNYNSYIAFKVQGISCFFSILFHIVSCNQCSTFLCIIRFSHFTAYFIDNIIRINPIFVKSKISRTKWFHWISISFLFKGSFNVTNYWVNIFIKKNHKRTNERANDRRKKELFTQFRCKQDIRHEMCMV